MVPWWSKQLSGGGGEFENVAWRRVGLWIFFNIFLHMFNKDGVKNRDVTIFNCEIDFSRRCSCFFGGVLLHWHARDTPPQRRHQNDVKFKTDMFSRSKGMIFRFHLSFQGEHSKMGMIIISCFFLEKLHMADWIWRSEVVKIGDFGLIIYIYTLHTF